MIYGEKLSAHNKQHEDEMSAIFFIFHYKAKRYQLGAGIQILW